MLVLFNSTVSEVTSDLQVRSRQDDGEPPGSAVGGHRQPPEEQPGGDQRLERRQGAAGELPGRGRHQH